MGVSSGRVSTVGGPGRRPGGGRLSGGEEPRPVVGEPAGQDAADLLGLGAVVVRQGGEQVVDLGRPDVRRQLLLEHPARCTRPAALAQLVAEAGEAGGRDGHGTSVEDLVPYFQ